MDASPRARLSRENWVGIAAIAVSAALAIAVPVVAHSMSFREEVRDELTKLRKDAESKDKEYAVLAAALKENSEELQSTREAVERLTGAVLGANGLRRLP